MVPASSFGGNVSSAYRLERRRVPTEHLLLDPGNPRLVHGTDVEREYSPEDILLASVQDDVLRAVRQDHDVASLVESIRAKGYVTGGQPILVRRVVGSTGAARYIVLEGNRRSAALKLLLAQGSALPATLRDAVRAVDVQEFTYIDTPGLPEEEVVDVLLGTIHVDGPRSWGAWQKAVYVYRSYMREIAREGLGAVFVYYADIAERVGTRFNMSGKAVKKALTVFNTYRDLESAGYEVTPTHYHLIDLATGNRVLRIEYFELDRDGCCISETGLERFGELCLVPGAAVHNPKLFKKFAFVVAHGTELDVVEASAAERKLHSACERIQARIDRRAFRDDLEEILELLRELRPAGFKETKQEQWLIRRIANLVRQKLEPLAAS